MAERLTIGSVKICRDGYVVPRKGKGVIGEVQCVLQEWRYRLCNEVGADGLKRWSLEAYRRQTDALSALLARVNGEPSE